MRNTDVGCDARSPGGDYITVMWYRRRQAYLDSLKQEEQRHLNIALKWRKQLRPCWPWWWWCHQTKIGPFQDHQILPKEYILKSFCPMLHTYNNRSFSGPPNTPKGVYLEKLCPMLHTYNKRSFSDWQLNHFTWNQGDCWGQINKHTSWLR